MNVVDVILLGSCSCDRGRRALFSARGKWDVRKELAERVYTLHTARMAAGVEARDCGASRDEVLEQQISNTHKVNIGERGLERAVRLHCPRCEARCEARH